MKGGLKAEQVLTIQPGGRTLVNRMTVRKFGMPVAHVDELITKQRLTPCGARSSGYSLCPRGAEMNEQAKPQNWSMARVVTASSAGTAFEWYDFFIFGSLTPVIAKVFFAGLDPTAALVAALALVRGRLRLPAAGRDHLRRDGRPRRAQGDLPRPPSA